MVLLLLPIAVVICRQYLALSIFPLNMHHHYHYRDALLPDALVNIGVSLIDVFQKDELLTVVTLMTLIK